MQLTNTVLFALAAVASAQSDPASQVAQIPKCAESCLNTGIQASGCGISDYACQCGSKRDAITANVTPCVLKACTPAEALMVSQITNNICSSVASASSSSEAPTSATEAPSSATDAPASSTEAPTSTTEVPASTEAPESAAMSTCACSTSAAVVVTETASYSATSAAVVGTETASSSAAFSPNSTSSAPIQIFTGAANKVQIGMGMVVGVAAAVMAL